MFRMCESFVNNQSCAYKNLRTQSLPMKTVIQTFVHSTPDALHVIKSTVSKEPKKIYTDQRKSATDLIVS